MTVMVGPVGHPRFIPATRNLAFDDEFDSTDTSDPIGSWTTLGTPTAHDTNSTVPSAYYAEKAAGSLGLVGIYKAVPSFPFTVSTEVIEYVASEGNGRAQLMIGTSTPGAMVTLGFGERRSAPSGSLGFIYLDNWTNRTTYGSTRHSLTSIPSFNHFRFEVASSTDVTAYVSENGLFWTVFGTANFNPGFTIGSVGLIIDPGASGINVKAAFDHIWFE